MSRPALLFTRPYKFQARRRMPTGGSARAAYEVANFWSQVIVGAELACWPWQGRTNGPGCHGVARWYGDRLLAHRAAWQIAHQTTVPPGLVVRHLCGARLCCNPRHLTPGTKKENRQDALRHAAGERLLFVADVPPSWSTPEPVDVDARAYEAEVERFWSLVDRTGDCWLWTDTWAAYGYGFYRWTKQVVLAHRIAYILTYGDYDLDLHLLHSCDTPACCNPAHLRPGTPQENREDARSRGRLPHGVRHRDAKLTEEDVVAIREAAAVGTYSTTLAEQYGLTTSSIHKVVSGRSWAHVGGPLTKSMKGRTHDVGMVTRLRTRAADGATDRQLAAEFGLGVPTVRKLRLGELGKHCPTPVVRRSSPGSDARWGKPAA